MRISHAALYVSDLNAMKAFYETYFGAASNELYHNPVTGLKTYFLSFEGGSRLEIMSRPDIPQRDASAPQATGYAHISFAAGSRKNVDSLTERLKNGGYTVVSGPRVTGDGFYESCVLDPEGNQIEITGEAPDTGPFYHGTKADITPGGLLTPGHSSNFGKRKTANFIYMSATLEAAIWGAELALGDAPPRIYSVEPTGSFEDDPNLTDMKFPGNPTRSYRTKSPLRVIGEVTDWEPHPPEALNAMLKNLEQLKERGIEAIND